MASGALATALKIFEANDINLIHIESRPSKSIIGVYDFYAAVDNTKGWCCFFFVIVVLLLL